MDIKIISNFDFAVSSIQYSANGGGFLTYIFCIKAKNTEHFSKNQ